MERKTRTRPLFYYEIGMEARDMLTQGYMSSGSKKFTVSTCNASGMTLQSSFVQEKPKHILKSSYGERLGAYVKAMGDYKCAKFSFQFDARRSKRLIYRRFVDYTSTELVFTNKFRTASTMSQVSLKYPAHCDSNVKIWTRPHRNVVLVLRSDLNKAPEISLMASVGTPRFTFGMQGILGITARGCFTVWDAGIQVTRPSWDASVTLRVNYMKEELWQYESKGDWLKASYLHYLGESRKICAAAEMSRCLLSNRTIFRAGGSLAIDKLTNVKARIDQYGNIGAMLEHKIFQDKALFKIAVDVKTRKALTSKPRIGLSLLLNP